MILLCCSYKSVVSLWKHLKAIEVDAKGGKSILKQAKKSIQFYNFGPFSKNAFLMEMEIRAELFFAQACMREF